ncbi:MAG: FAD-dependent oxidoreductase [Steroidobacteraceae bacterium]
MSDDIKITKRSFLSMIAATAALSVADRSMAQDKGPTWDVIVVGGGNSGLPAAIFAAERGARVLIIEAAASLGGTLFLSSGQMSAAGTKLQQQKGIDDSGQLHYDDIMRISKKTANPRLVKLAVFNAAETFDWLMDHGFDVRPEQPVTGTTHEPYSRARYAWGKDGGKSILRVLNEQLKPHLDAGRVQALTSTQAKELLLDAAGAVVGVAALDGSGKLQNHYGKNVALTTGGYTANTKMFEQYEKAKRYSVATYPYSQGAGITLGLGAGGYVRGGEHHLGLFGAIMTNDTYPSPFVATIRPWPPTTPPWGIYVNRQGKRFLREDIPSHDAFEQALRVQTDERCWLVLDDEMIRTMPPFIGRWTREQILESFGTKKNFFKAGDLEALAAATGIDGKALATTVAQYNQGQARGKDALGRTHMPLPIAKGPYYAVRLQSWALISFAGLAVNDSLQVIRRDGKPIRNLYAAGELLGAGQCMGRSYCGGMSVTPALTFGRLLGQRILKFAT